jgi:periplasmic protein TonB
MRFTSTLAAAGLVFFSVVTMAKAQEPSSVARPGQDVTAPQVVREVKPVYTESAKKERIQGTVAMDVVVQADGSVGDVTVTRSLDKQHGLDDEAVKAAKQWRFAPGKKDGNAVPVLVEIEMSFTLK